MASAADVPGKFDVVVNGEGYIFLDTLDVNLPFRTHRASYSLTPTFVQRQNTSGDYGDNQQDFYLTYAQRDWSGGEGQRFFRTDDVRSRKFWSGQYVDISIEGQVTAHEPAVSGIAAQSLYCVAQQPSGPLFAGGSANLYGYNPGPVFGDLGAHGLGCPPAPFGIVADPRGVYLTSTAAGSVGVRRYNTVVPAFSTFSASAADSLAFAGNTLYGYRETSGDFVKWDAAGALTSIYTWKDSTGTAVTGTAGGFSTRLRPYGGKVLILRANGENRSELWQYDGTNTAKLVDLPGDFSSYDLAVNGGYIVISGVTADFNQHLRPQLYVYSYASNTISLAWQSENRLNQFPITRNHAGIASYRSGVVFVDRDRGAVMYYNAANGALSTVGTPTAAVAQGNLIATVGVSSSGQGFFVVDGTSNYFATAGNAALDFNVSSSLIDFDSSLSKRFRAVKVEFDAATDGNGGTVDIAYQLNSVAGSYTSLQTGITSGTEYAIDQTAQSISIRVTLKPGSSTYGPKLKRIYVRAVPIQPQYKLREYVLDCSGSQKKNNYVKLRNERYHTKTGAALAAALNTAVGSTTPISITDRFGTFTGVVQPDQFELIEIHPGEFVARVVVREV